MNAEKRNARWEFISYALHAIYTAGAPPESERFTFRFRCDIFKCCDDGWRLVGFILLK